MILKNMNGSCSKNTLRVCKRTGQPSSASMVAAMAANEMLARIHKFRYEENDAYAVQRYTLHEPHVFLESEGKLNVCPVLSKEVGRGDTTPLLDRPELSERRK